MAEEKKEEAAAPEAAAAPESSAAPVDGKIKLFLIVNMVLVAASIGVSVVSFMKMNKPQVADISAGGEHGAEEHGGGEGGHGKEEKGGHGGGHGEKVAGESEESNKINLDRFIVNLANSGGEAVVTVSFQIIFSDKSDMAAVKSFVPKMRDLTINLLSSKNVSEMSSVEGREDLKAQMKTGFDSMMEGKATVKEVLFMNLFINTGA